MVEKKKKPRMSFVTDRSAADEIRWLIYGRLVVPWNKFNRFPCSPRDTDKFSQMSETRPNAKNFNTR